MHLLLNYGAKIRLFFDSLWTFAKIREDNRKKLVLSSEMTKINLPVTKIEISVTKIESSVTKIRPLFLWRQGCDVKAWSQKTSFLLLKTYIKNLDIHFVYLYNTLYIQKSWCLGFTSHLLLKNCYNMRNCVFSNISTKKICVFSNISTKKICVFSNIFEFLHRQKA